MIVCECCSSITAIIFLTTVTGATGGMKNFCIAGKVTLEKSGVRRWPGMNRDVRILGHLYLRRRVKNTKDWDEKENVLLIQLIS